MGRFVGFPAWETIKATQVKGRLPQTPRFVHWGELWTPPWLKLRGAAY